MLDEEQPSKRQQQGWRSRVENHKKLPIHLNWLSFASRTLLVYQCFYDVFIGYQGKRSPIPILQLFYVHPHHSWGQKGGAMGFHRRHIGDWLSRYWGFTSSPLGIHFLAIGDSLQLYWGLIYRTQARFTKNAGSFYLKRRLVLFVKALFCSFQSPVANRSLSCRSA